MCNLPAPHAPLHPINRTQQSAVSARAAGSQFASQQMLSRAVLCGARGKNKVKLKGFRLARISQTVQSLTIGLFKNLFSCYFWRKSNQNVGVGCAIEEAGSRQTLPHKSCWKIL